MKNIRSRAAASLGCALACIALLAQDGDALAAAPTGHYVVGSGSLAGTVLDTETGLRWQQAVDGTRRSQADSRTYCGDLSTGGGTFSDWRLPSVLELASLVDESVVDGSGPTIDSSAFPLTERDRFWSSSPVAGSPLLGWRVFFGVGNASFNVLATDLNLARCVR